MFDFADAFDEEPKVNPAVLAKERIRKILEQQAEDVLNGTSSVKPMKEKKEQENKFAELVQNIQKEGVPSSSCRGGQSLEVSQLWEHGRLPAVPA